MIKKMISLCLMLIPSAWLTAQAVGAESPSTGLRADGKIWVVMAVCLTILAGLFVYLIRIDRRISALEKEPRP